MYICSKFPGDTAAAGPVATLSALLPLSSVFLPSPGHLLQNKDPQVPSRSAEPDAPGEEPDLSFVNRHLVALMWTFKNGALKQHQAKKQTHKSI